MVNRSANKNMVLIKNKRGIFFTIFMIVVLTLFITTFTFYSNVNERKTTQDRITTMNNFVFSIEKDLSRQLKISTFRIIFLLQKELIETGSYISDVDSSFNEAFFNGTINGKTNPEIETLMEGATFPDILSSLQTKAKKINANITITNPSISIRHENPWNIKLTLSSNFVIKDLSNLARWNKTEDITAETSIENFEDPIYIIGTSGISTNKIIKTPYSNFVSGSDISNLSDHSQNSYYHHTTESPNFLMRMEGNLNSDANGIESIVNLEKLSSQGITLKDKSAVDHVYFSASNPSACNVVPAGMPSWFKLDSTHLSIYQVSCA